MTTAAVIFGRGGSKGIPNKNVMDMLGKKLVEYPIIASQKASSVDFVYVSTDCEQIIEVAKDMGCGVIERPAELCSDKALLQDAILHAYEVVKELHPDLEYFVVQMANTPNITHGVIDRGAEMLEKNAELDSVITVGRFDMYSPERARKDDGSGCLQPYISFDKFDNEISCDRSSHDATYFADGGMTFVRTKSLDIFDENLLPFKWMGKKIGYIEQEAGVGDIDYLWQVETAKWWLAQHAKEI